MTLLTLLSAITITISGHCTSRGGTLWFHTWGFTPGGAWSMTDSYKTPGNIIGRYTSPAPVEQNGRLGLVKFACAGLPAGTWYRTFTDRATRRSIRFPFRISR